MSPARPALAAFLALVLAATARAGEPPAVASDADAAAAVAKFKEDFKATGLKGDDRTSQRDYAMAELSKVQHPQVVEALAGVTRNPDETLRMIAVVYLGQQKALPGLAGAKVLAAMKKESDTVFTMSSLQAVGSLGYLGAKEDIRNLLKHQDFAIKKCAILAAGETRDMRLLEDVLAIAGINIPTGKDGAPADPPDKSGGKEVVEEGYSWEGAEASVDTGTAGDGDQKAAEAKVKDQIAKNKAAAEQGRSQGGGPSAGGGDGGSAGGRGAASRTNQELMPAVVRAVTMITGQSFGGGKDVKKWIYANRDQIVARKKALDEAEKAQRAAATPAK